MSLPSSKSSSNASTQSAKADIAKLRKKEKILKSFLPQRVLNDLQETSLRTHPYMSNAHSRSPSQSLTSSDESSSTPCALYSREAKDVSIIFCDIVGFSSIAKEISPSDVMEMLQNLFYRFDAISKKYNILKLDTIGDAYFCASGLLPEENDSSPGVVVDVATCNGMRCGVGGGSGSGSGSRHEKRLRKKEEQHQQEYARACATRALFVAKEMIKEARKVEIPYSSKQQEEKEYLNIRVGIHVGNVTYGILGQHLPKLMCVGNTVNITQQMEQTSLPGLIHVSKDFYDIIHTMNAKKNSKTLKANEIVEKEFSRIYPQRMNIENMGEVETWFFDPLERREKEKEENSSSKSEVKNTKR